MASFNGPKLTNPIRTDIPDTQEVLVALAKQDPTPISDIPSGAKRLVAVSSGKWQWQGYNGSSWAAVPFLQHNVDQLDGYHAAITPAANTVAVRNASGLLQDSITGNAATASTAATLSQTLPVNKGGTGATTSEAARSNLGVPPTSHASTNTTHGVGNATQYGHLKLSDATNSSSGVTGGVAATPAAVKAAKDAADAAQSSADAAQSSADAATAKASTIATTSTPGIVKPGTGMTVDAAGALNVNASSASIPGLVKSSTTAAAGAVPLGREDGSLDKSWTWEVGEYRVAHAESMDGGLLCNGAAVSRTTYNRLFAKIGTKFGEGDGKTTFNLPDFRNRTLWGADDNLGAVIEAGLPGIYGTFGEGYLGESDMPATGAFGRKSGGPLRISGTNVYSNVGTYTFDASKSSGKYGKSDTVQPPAIAVNVFIKY